jgi:hypothetical protein
MADYKSLNIALIEVPDENISGYHERHDCTHVTLALRLY